MQMVDNEIKTEHGQTMFVFNIIFICIFWFTNSPCALHFSRLDFLLLEVSYTNGSINDSFLEPICRKGYTPSSLMHISFVFERIILDRQLSLPISFQRSICGFPNMTLLQKKRLGICIHNETVTCVMCSPISFFTMHRKDGSEYIILQSACEQTKLNPAKPFYCTKGLH